MKQKFTLEAEKCVAYSRTSNFNLPTSVFCVDIEDVTPVARFSLEVPHGYMNDDNKA
jgi:hypothetical protein